MSNSPKLKCYRLSILKIANRDIVPLFQMHSRQMALSSGPETPKCKCRNVAFSVSSKTQICHRPFPLFLHSILSAFWEYRENTDTQFCICRNTKFGKMLIIQFANSANSHPGTILGMPFATRWPRQDGRRHVVEPLDLAAIPSTTEHPSS